MPAQQRAGALPLLALLVAVLAARGAVRAQFPPQPTCVSAPANAGDLLWLPSSRRPAARTPAQCCCRCHADRYLHAVLSSQRLRKKGQGKAFCFCMNHWSSRFAKVSGKGCGRTSGRLRVYALQPRSLAAANCQDGRVRRTGDTGGKQRRSGGKTDGGDVHHHHHQHININVQQTQQQSSGAQAGAGGGEGGAAVANAGNTAANVVNIHVPGGDAASAQHSGQSSTATAGGRRRR